MASRQVAILQLMVILLILLAVEGSSQCSQTIKKKLKPLYILTLLPLPIRTSNESHFRRERRSLSQIAGAHVAQHEINKRRDLPGYRLEMIVESTGPICVHSPIHLMGTGLDTVVKYAVNPPCPPLVAINGLSCNLQTSYLSYIAEKRRLDLIHFTARRLRTVSEETDFTRLWRIVDSGAVYVDAVMSLMDEFDWNRIAIVYNKFREFQSIVALRIHERVLNSPNKELIFTASVRGIYREQSFDEIAQFLKNRAGRVLIIALDQNQSAELLCRIAEEGLVYPAFTAILIDMPNILNL